MTDFETQNGPKWRTEVGKNPIDHEKFAQEIGAVEAPLQDPVYGENGPMMSLWQAR